MNSAQTGSVAHVFAAPGAVGAVPGSAVAGVGQVTLALCIVLGAIFLYYGMKAVQLTEMSNRVWKRTAEYNLILTERKRLGV